MPPTASRAWQADTATAGAGAAERLAGGGDAWGAAVGEGAAGGRLCGKGAREAGGDWAEATAAGPQMARTIAITAAADGEALIGTWRD